MKRHDEFQFQPTARLAAFRTPAFWPLLWLAVLLCPPTAALAQISEPGCEEFIDCNNLKADIKLINPNFGSDCSANTACGGGNTFGQLFYKVRLKYTTTNPSDELDFYLDYDKVTVSVDLFVAGTAPLYSHIDKDVTEDCTENGPGLNWNKTFVNVETPYSANIIFEELLANGACTGDKIHFQPSSDPNDCTGLGNYCAYADLFIVAVNAYPGETVQLKIPSGGATYNGNGGCTLSHTTSPSPIVVTALDAPSAAPNSNVLVQLTDPLPVTSGPGKCFIDIEVVNSNAAEIFIDYLEFVIKIGPDPSSLSAFMVSSLYNDPPVKVGNDYYVRFVNGSGTSIAANSTAKLGRITLFEPVIQNQMWSTLVALVDGTKSRLKTSYPTDPSTYYCSRLPLDSEVKKCDGGTPCNYDLLFKIWPPENVSTDCPSEKRVKVGFTSGSLPKAYLRRLAFALQFDLSDGAAITDVNTNSFCLANIPGDCFDFMGSTESDCWKAESGGIFKFCFDVSTEPDPVTLDLSGDGAYMEIEFNTEGCINGVNLVSLEIESESPYQGCPPGQEPASMSFTLCEPEIFGQLATELDKPLEDAQITLTQIEDNTPCINTNCPPTTETTGSSGAYSFCPCSVCDKFEIKPENDNDPINGVSTFDLVLINKHILGLEPLDSPYKRIAADVNKSNTITTYDLIELRKLILGNYTMFNEIPNTYSQTSWRFVDKDYVFPNPLNPFEEIFPEKKLIDMSVSSMQEANFVAVKVGDVNGNAVTSNAIPKPVTSLSITAPNALQAGQFITLPVKYTGSEPLEAFQLGLRFDPKKLSLIGASQGDLPGYNNGNFGLNKADQGEVRTLWFADPTMPDAAVHSGDILFYLSFLVKTTAVSSTVLLELDDTLLPNTAWQPNGKEFSLRSNTDNEERVVADAAELTSVLQASWHPNPAFESAQLIIRSDRSGKARLAIFGAFGRREWMREVSLEKGNQVFDIPEIAQLPAGVYFWKVLTPWAKTQGHIIKQ